MKQRESPRKSRGGAQGYRLIQTRSGVRMVQHGTVLSEIRTSPGPTHSVADVIAAAVQATACGPRVAMLGFAGGGMLAPLRAMGGDHTLAAVDLDDSGWWLFRRLCSGWAGEVSFDRAEACTWLRGGRCRYDAIIEDLSVARNSDVFKPVVTWSQLPPLLYSRLNEGGVAIFNLLRPTESSWERGVARLLREGCAASVVEFTDYENRLLISGTELPPARKLGLLLRKHLRRIHSRLASRITIGTCGTAMVPKT